MPARELVARVARMVARAEPPAAPEPAVAPKPPPSPWTVMRRQTERLGRALRERDPDLAEVDAGGTKLLAWPVTGRLDGYPAAVRGNLDLVTAAAAAAGVDAGLVDSNDPGRHAVAVRDEQAPDLLRELVRRYADEAVYLRALTDGARPRELPDGAPVVRVQGLDLLAGAVDLDAWPGPAEAPVLQVFRAWTGPGHRTVIAAAAACEVEFWYPDPDTSGWVPPRSNRRVSQLPAWPAPTRPPVGDLPCPGLVAQDLPLDLDVQFPIDLVYTWVDGSDPELAARRARYQELEDTAAIHPSATSEARWRDRDELRYALRSVEAFASWIRHVWIVTEDQCPHWLDVDNPRVSVVSSSDIFVDRDLLPTFNSHAVEAQLHHIDGLAEHYLYSNDDYFFGRPVRPETFFLGTGLGRVFRSRLKIDEGVATAGDRPVLSAHKNHRQIFERDFGVTITSRLKHAVAVQRRSVMYELEKRYPQEFTRTVAARFRRPSDLSFASTFGPYYLLLTGRAYPAPLAYGYVDSVEAATPETLAGWLVGRDRDAFCINDAGLVAEGLSPQRQHEMVTGFLAEYFPWPSSFELPPEQVDPGAPAASIDSTA